MSERTTSEVFAEQVADKVNEKFAGAGIEVSLIIALIQSLVTECFPTDQSAIDAAADPSGVQLVLMDFRIRRQLRAQTAMNRRDRVMTANLILESLLECAATASREDLCGIHSELK